MRTAKEINAALAALDSRRETIDAELREIHERCGDRALNAGEQERWNRLNAGLDKITEERRGLIAELAGLPGHIETTTPGEVASSRTGEFGRARSVIDTAARSGLLPEHAAEKATHLIEHGPGPHRTLAARWATVTGAPEYLSAFGKLLGDPARGHLMWNAAEQRAFQAVAEVQSEFRAMSLADASGGFMVPLTLDPSILLTSAGSINPLRRISRTVQTVTDQWQGVSSAGVTAEWKAEAAQVADASPTLGDEPIPVHFGDAFVPYSFEVGMDAVDFLGELQTLLVDGADQLQATAYTAGTGTGQPTGVITALDGTASEVAPATLETFAAADVYETQNQLPPRFSANAQWCAEISTINEMNQFETTAGMKQFEGLANDRLLRKPINELSNMDAFGDINPAVTADNHILLYGDFRHFVIADRIGTTLELIPNLMGAGNRPTGQRGALLWFRTGSNVVVPNAFRVLNVATTL